MDCRNHLVKKLLIFYASSIAAYAVEDIGKSQFTVGEKMHRFAQNYFF